MIADAESTNHNPERYAISAQGVHKAYRRGPTRTPVLKGVDLEVEQGKCVFLAGPSGSGKKTLLSILGCILSADRGRVRNLDQDILALYLAGEVYVIGVKHQAVPAGNVKFVVYCLAIEYIGNRLGYIVGRELFLLHHGCPAIGR